jgi:segregation and condensation protein A
MATYQDLDLHEFVQNATWRELLTELVSTSRLDPWDIDLVKVVDSYLGAIKRMKVLDLRIPANMVLAASILLRMKSDTISIFEIQQEEPQVLEADMQQRVRPEVEALVPRSRMQPRRRITLTELLGALDDAIKLEDRRRIHFEKVSTPVSLFIKSDDIDEKKESVFKIIKGTLDKTGLTTFALLTRNFTNLENVLIDLFVPLLFLAHENRITMVQENFFGEIFIKPLKGGVVGRAAK